MTIRINPEDITYVRNAAGDRSNILEHHGATLTTHRDGTVSLRLSEDDMKMVLDGAAHHEYVMYQRFTNGVSSNRAEDTEIALMCTARERVLQTLVGHLRDRAEARWNKMLDQENDKEASR